MKRKELLQKSSTVAAVVLAAALMDPGAVQASAGDQSAAANAAQVMEQSAETGESTAVESVETESQADSDEQAAAAESGEETDETKQETESEPAESTENTAQEAQNKNTEDAVSAEETTDTSENTTDNTNAVTTESDADDTDESVTTGWFQTDDGNTRYRKEDGTVYCDEFAKIDGKWYFFGWYGNLTKDTTFTKWSTVTFHDRYYKATADGSLVTNQWDESGNMYYGEDGGSVAGVQMIDGKQYYFDSNCSLRRGGRLEDIEGNCYFVDDDGVLTLAENNSWTEYNGKYYYVKDGAFLSNGVEKIGDDYYGFRWDGSRYDDCTFSEWDDETKQNIYYRAATGGKLVTGWYEENGEKYYYEADGKAYNGFREIDGKKYYFYYQAIMQSDGSVVQGEKTYLVGKDGSLTEAKNNDWTKVDDNYYYMKDGKLLEDCVEKIGNAYYGFDENGRMYNNEAFSIRDYDTREWNYYQAKEGGQLAIGWYETDENKCYYGEDGKQFRDVVIKIGNLYYGFDWYGNMYRDTNFNVWHSETQSSDYYRASADGSLVIGWYEYSGRKYYYGTDGKRYEGLQTIDGKQYYFRDGRLQYSTRIEEKGTYYIAASDGVLTEVKNNAWI